jgi:hypothetical protein
MDPRDLVASNAYLGPASFSVDLPCIRTIAQTNWGVCTGQVLSVTLDPQVDADNTYFTSHLSASAQRRRVRRRVLSDLASEFSVWNNDLLRQLAE